MEQSVRDRQTRDVSCAEKLSDIVDSWRDENGDDQPERYVIVGLTLDDYGI